MREFAVKENELSHVVHQVKKKKQLDYSVFENRTEECAIARVIRWTDFFFSIISKEERIKKLENGN